MKTETIKNRLFDEFNIQMDESTITRYLREFRQGKSKVYTLCGNGKEGYYVKNDYGVVIPNEFTFNNAEMNFLYLSVLNSRQLNMEQKSFLIEKLSYQCTNEIIKENIESHRLLNVDKNEGVDGYANLDTFIEAISKKYPIKISSEYRINSEIFYPYAYLPASDGNLFLIGTRGGTMIRSINCNSIEKFEILKDKKFSETKPILKYDFFFDSERIEYLKKNYPNNFVFPTEQEVVLQQKLDEIYKLSNKLRLSRNFNESDAKKLIEKFNSILLLRNFKLGNRNLFFDTMDFISNNDKILIDYKIRNEDITLFLIFSSLLALTKEEFNYFSSNNMFKKFNNFVFDLLKEYDDKNAYNVALDWFKNGKTIREISEEYKLDIDEVLKYKTNICHFLMRKFNKIHEFYESCTKNENK